MSNIIEILGDRSPELTGKVVCLYEVLGNIDATKGKGGFYTVGWYENISEATEVAKDKGFMGYEGQVKKVQALKVAMVDGSFSFFKLEKLPIVAQEDIRQKALAKLTSEEKRVLGL